MSALRPHPDLLFPADPGVREMARRLYDEVADAPIVLAPRPRRGADAARRPAVRRSRRPARDARPLRHPPVARPSASNSISSASPAPAAALRPRVARSGVGSASTGTPSSERRCDCGSSSSWPACSASSEQPSAANADELYDQLSATARPGRVPAARPVRRFGIAVLATTDDPAADLVGPPRPARRPDLLGPRRADLPPRPLPRPVDAPAGRRRSMSSAAAAGVDCGTFAGLIDALRVRRAAFAAAGGTRPTPACRMPACEPLDAATAERLHAAGRAGTIDAAQAVAYRGNLLYRLAELSSEDGLVMQLHPGVLRGHHAPTLAAYRTRHRARPAGGHRLHPPADPDPARLRHASEVPPRPVHGRRDHLLARARPARRLLSERLRRFALVVPRHSRMRCCGTVAPSPTARGSARPRGFIDDTRAFCSIPARHEVARRVDSGYLASLVAEHRLSEEDAAATARRLVADIPLDVFRLADAWSAPGRRA